MSGPSGYAAGSGILQRPALAAHPAGPSVNCATNGPHGAQAQSYWQRAKARALERMEAMREAASANQDKAKYSAAENLEQVKVAAKEVMAQGNLRDRLRKAWALWQVVDSGPIAKWVARAMVASYYVNQVWEEVEAYQHLKSAPVRRRWADEPIIQPRFPYLLVLLILPCALLVACGVAVPLTGGLLLAETLYDDAVLSWRQILNIVRYGSRPTELLAKRLAIMGAAMLVVAHSIKDMPTIRTYAGMLMPETGGQRPSRRKSALLLAGRLLVACLFVFAGYTQIRRITARGGTLWQATAGAPRDAAMVPGQAPGGKQQASIRHHYGVPDSHDNNWLLLELALCLPFVLGWKTPVVCRLLTGVLLLEALTCWPFWAWYWPSWHYRAHVRLHFFTNMAMAGGLVLLQALGAGEFTVDRLLNRKAD